MRTPNNISKPHPQEPSGQRLSRVNMASGDPTLDEIRARRLAELQAQYGGGVRDK